MAPALLPLGVNNWHETNCPSGRPELNEIRETVEETTEVYLSHRPEAENTFKVAQSS